MSTLFTQPPTYLPENHPLYPLLPFVDLHKLPIYFSIRDVRHLDKARLLYFLYQGVELVYIGQTGGISARLYCHKSDRREFTGVRVLPYPDWEPFYIRVFKPRFNVQLVRG